jgi:hypothetical protein
MSKNNKYIDWKNWEADSFGKTSKLEETSKLDETYFNNNINLF